MQRLLSALLCSAQQSATNPLSGGLYQEVNRGRHLADTSRLVKVRLGYVRLGQVRSGHPAGNDQGKQMGPNCVVHYVDIDVTKNATLNFAFEVCLRLLDFNNGLADH